MPADAWTEARESALLDAWRLEVERAIGGAPADERRTLLVEGVVVARSVLADLDAAARLGTLGELERRMTAACVVRMARWLRLLDLTRHDVRRLDLGRRRPRRA